PSILTHPCALLLSAPPPHHSIPPFLSFFFNPPPTPDIYPLSLHDALPIFVPVAEPLRHEHPQLPRDLGARRQRCMIAGDACTARSEEHTSELQSLTNLVCRLLLEKKKKKNNICTHSESAHTSYTLPTPHTH